MKLKGSVSFWGACAVVLLSGAASMGQDKTIADEDLLSLLQTVNEQPGSNPVERAASTLEAADERAAETDEVMVDSLGVDTNAVMDDLEIETLDEDASTSDGNLITVRLDDVSLEKAISLFAQLSDANIIVPQLTEAAQISVNLKDVAWRPALQSILDTYNYELYQRVSGSNVYAVRRRPAGAPEPQVVETFKLEYATVPNAAKLIKELLPADAKVSEFASRNMIVVKSTESSLSEVRAVLDAIDQVRQQVYIESKFMELSDDAQKDLGIDWAVLQAYSAGTVGSTDRTYAKRETKDSSSSSFSDLNGQAYEDASGYSENQRGGAGNPYTLEGVTPTASSLAAKGTTEVLTSVLNADEFRLVLSALEQSKGVNVVSNPKIIVANEEKANISIIRQEPNLKQSRQQALNDTPDTITFELDETRPFFDFGIKLDVTPSINTSSNITVKINPALTRKFGDKPAGENTYPIIDEKSIETIFNLASGQTAAIGGLTEVTEGEEERKVPLLGSIPYLGRLFSYKKTVRGQNETIIFVTVGLANTQDLNQDTGMPGDAELARRQMIKDANSRRLRDRGRDYFEATEDDKLEDMIKVMDAKEADRVERREATLQKEAAREAAKQRDVAYVN